MGLRIPGKQSAGPLVVDARDTGISPPRRFGEKPEKPILSKPVDEMSAEDMIAELFEIAAEETKEAATGFAVGAAEGATLGFAGEIAGAGITGKELVTGETPIEEAGERFREATTQAEGFIKEEQKKSPVASTIGTGLGMIGTAGATGLARGATALGTVAKSATMGGITGAGFSEARVEENPEQFAWDVVTGAVINPVTDLGSMAILGALSKIPAKIKKSSIDSAIKASTGQNLKQLRRLDRSGQWEKVGKGLLEKDEAGPALVRFGSTMESIAERAHNKREFFGAKIGAAIDSYDQLVKKGISGQDIASKLRAYAEKIPKTAKNDSRIKAILNEADRFDEFDMMTMNEAHKLKQDFRFEPQLGETPSQLRKNDTSKINRVISDSMEEAFQKDTPAIFNEYKVAKERFTVSAFADDAANERALKDINNRWISPSDYFAGASAGIATGGAPGVVMAAAINKIARERGRSGAANVADNIISAMERSPKLMQKWIPVLSRGAEKGGAGLIATHQFLIKTQPDYAAEFKSTEDENITPPQRIGE